MGRISRRSLKVQRIERASAAIYAYSRCQNVNRENPDLISPLLADLLHLAEFKGMNVNLLLSRAAIWFDVEREKRRFTKA